MNETDAQCVTAIPTTGWEQFCKGSGSQGVSSAIPGMPWIAAFGLRVDGDDDKAEREAKETRDIHLRHAMCADIAACLNGGPRPSWLADMDRVDEERIVGADFSEIVACGPMYDRNPPAHDWWTRDDDEAKGLRARLIDRLWLAK
jgi:hypothetical protein